MTGMVRGGYARINHCREYKIVLTITKIDKKKGKNKKKYFLNSEFFISDNKKDYLSRFKVGQI